MSAPPIRDATVAVEGPLIAYVGPRDSAPPGEDRELGESLLLPGLVNAHTHLELTAFRGMLDGLPFREWIVRLQRAKMETMTRELYLDSALSGIAEGLRAGITTYADTCDSGVALEAMRTMGVRGIMYQEVFCPSADPARVGEAAESLTAKLADLEPLETDLQRLGISPHAPYTCSDPLLALAARSGRPIAIHVAESEDETLLVRDASGAFAGPLRERGFAVAPRGRSPVELLQRLGMLDATPAPLLVHCVQVDDSDIQAIARSGAAVAHCPISNARLGHGVAPLLEMLSAGIPVGLGSDSMASNDRMHLLEEARVAVLSQRIRARSPVALTPSRALELATLGGARALGLSSSIGSLDPGKDADLAAFPIPPGAPSADPSSLAVFALGGSEANFVAVRGCEVIGSRKQEAGSRADSGVRAVMESSVIPAQAGIHGLARGSPLAPG